MGTTAVCLQGGQQLSMFFQHWCWCARLAHDRSEPLPCVCRARIDFVLFTNWCARLAHDSWEPLLCVCRARNDSSIVDHFQGLLKSTLDCPKCSHHKRKFDPFMYLSVPLPGADLQTREFTVVAADGSHLPLRCAATLPKQSSIADFCKAAAAVLEFDAALDPTALLAVAVLTWNRVTVHDNVADDLPSASGCALAFFSPSFFGRLFVVAACCDTLCTDSLSMTT